MKLQAMIIKRWAIGVVVFAVTFIVLVLTVIPIAVGGSSPTLRAVAALTSSDEQLTLSEGLQRSIALVDKTVAVGAPNLPVSPAPDNPAIEITDELENNYSLQDRSNTFRNPGFDDCDGWENLIDDGWRATYRINITLTSEQDAERVLMRIKRFWDEQGDDAQYVGDPTSGAVYSIVRNSNNATGIVMKAGYANYQVDVDPRQYRASIWATTDCLPPH